MANSNNSVVVTSLYGRKGEGIISGTPKPGIVVSIKASTEPVNGRYTWEAYNPGAGDGTPGLIAILDVDDEQGKTREDAYVSGTRCKLFFPVPGDELQLRKADISGTGSATEDLNIGEKLLVVSGTGYISPVAVGIIASPVSYPFQSLETVTDQPAETFVRVIFTGY